MDVVALLTCRDILPEVRNGHATPPRVQVERITLHANEKVARRHAAYELAEGDATTLGHALVTVKAEQTALIVKDAPEPTTPGQPSGEGLTFDLGENGQ